MRRRSVAEGVQERLAEGLRRSETAPVGDPRQGQVGVDDESGSGFGTGPPDVLGRSAPQMDPEQPAEQNQSPKT